MSVNLQAIMEKVESGKIEKKLSQQENLKVISRVHSFFKDEAEKVKPQLQKIFGKDYVRVDSKSKFSNLMVSEGSIGTILSVFGKGSFDLSINNFSQIYYNISWYSSSAQNKLQFNYDMSDVELKEIFDKIFASYFETTYKIWFRNK